MSKAHPKPKPRTTRGHGSQPANAPQPAAARAGRPALHQGSAWIAGCAMLAAVFAWSYWPIFQELLAAWKNEPDYSHGYLVLPIALYFLWARRQNVPPVAGVTTGSTPAWGGLALVALAVAMRVVGALFYIEAVAAWSLPIWIGGLCWLAAGRQVFRWALPAIGFLVFMVPLPYRLEQTLSLPLQRVATEISCWLLQCFGQPALAEGNVLVLGDVRLEVAQACSGLRMFVSIVALAYAYAVLSARPWWMKALLFAGVAPIAMLANSVRVAGTGLLFQHVSGKAARDMVHDLGGVAMIPLAALLMALLLWYLGRLIVEVQAVEPRELLGRARAEGIG